MTACWGSCSSKQWQQQYMARDKKAAQKQKPAKAAAGAAAVKAEAKKGRKAQQGSYDGLCDPLDRCGCASPEEP